MTAQVLLQSSISPSTWILGPSAATNKYLGFICLILSNTSSVVLSLLNIKNKIGVSNISVKSIVKYSKLKALSVVLKQIMGVVYLIQTYFLQIFYCKLVV